MSAEELTFYYFLIAAKARLQHRGVVRRRIFLLSLDCFEHGKVRRCLLRREAFLLSLDCFTSATTPSMSRPARRAALSTIS